MRSAILLTAALAAGACAAELDKRVYVTDWTTVIVTETVTAALPPAQTEPPVPADQESTLTKKTTAVPEVTTDTPKANNAEPDSGSGGLLGNLLGGGDSETTKDEKPHHKHHHKHKPAPAPTTTEQAPAPAPTTTTVEAPPPEPTTITETAVPTTMSTTTTTTTDTPAPTTNSYQSDVLYNHNIHRSNHSAPSVSWDDRLEQTAHTLAARCVYQHDT